MVSELVYIGVMIVVGIVAHKVTVSILGMKNMFKDFRLDDSDDIG